MINCVIFDMDGVVVNSEPLSYEASRGLYSYLNITVPDDVYATFTGNSDKNIAQKLIDLYSLDITVDELVDRKLDYFLEAFPKIELMPGVLSLIQELHANGMKLILASSSTKRKINKVFEHFGLYKYFDHIVSGEDFEQSKPHPAIFIEAAAKSGFPREECIVIEDSTNGIKAAKAAGIYCIAYKSGHGFPQDVSEADMVITDFRELSYTKIISLAD